MPAHMKGEGTVGIVVVFNPDPQNLRCLAMRSFLDNHASEIKGVLSGFDRVRFRGTLRLLANVQGLMTYLGWIGVLYKDFRVWSMGLTEQVREATAHLAEACGRPVYYLASCHQDKEATALRIAKEDGIQQGLICVLTCIESCNTFQIRKNRQRQMLELSPLAGRCLHQYFYSIHPQFGLMQRRRQTWLPFTIHVNINGREWLERQLRQEGIAYRKSDNCFTDVADIPRAQQLLHEQLQTHWDTVLNDLVRQFHPLHAQLFDPQTAYYWSADETEWATDVMFRSPAVLSQVFPSLVRYCVDHLGCDRVLHFLGRRPEVYRFWNSEITTSIERRHEGTRCKHALNANSIKMYDKQGSVLRVETTINNPRDMRVYRTKENDPDGQSEWQPMRKGVSDLHRRAEVSQAANERYLETLANVEHTAPLQASLDKVCRPTTLNGRRVRALNPFGPDDLQLLKSIHQGEFAINGFRNRDLQKHLFRDEAVNHKIAKQRSGKVTRLIRLLRAHHLIRKVPKTHRYQLAANGKTIVAAILAAQQASTKQLLQMAA